MNNDQTTVTIHKGYGSCEDCGGYEWGRVVISRDGVEVCREAWDGHLGGSIQGPDYGLDEFLSVVLRAVGVDAKVEIINDDE